jgi:ATP/maltotriose-dependent transcriptional regulator MalT
MRRLPAHHVPRPRLTRRCDGLAVVVVEAGAGYGKTVLAARGLTCLALCVSTWRPFPRRTAP